MPVINQNWYDLQAGRKYPLDDASTCLDDNGNTLRNDLIVDCHIKFPNVAGDVAFVQAITVTANIVTVLIGVASSSTNAVATIAAVSLPKPAEVGVNYDILPLLPGVAGWIVFGPGIAEAFSGRYATPQQTKLAARNARGYAALPVPSLGKSGLAQAMTGVIAITVDAPIVAEKQSLIIDGKAATAVVFKLDAALSNVAYNPLAYFLGPCGIRPESGTCPSPPIETINGVAPDCLGNINIIGDGVDLYAFNGCGGIGLDIGLGLADACQKTPYGPPREPKDNCEPASSSSSTPAGSSSSSTQPIEPSSSTSSAVLRTLPLCEPFTAAVADIVDVRSGNFAVKTVLPNSTALTKCAP